MPISEDGERTWDPYHKATERQLEFVLEYLIANAPCRQDDIVKAMLRHMRIPTGTAAAATSASLLYFKLAGWVKPGATERRSTIWHLNED